MAHRNPLRWYRLLPWICQRSDLIRPTAAPANPRKTPGGIIPLQGGGIIPELGAASSGISRQPRGSRSAIATSKICSLIVGRF
jgi:hypothetical protein